jgi:hypothetical protein
MEMTLNNVDIDIISMINILMVNAVVHKHFLQLLEIVSMKKPEQDTMIYNYNLVGIIDLNYVLLVLMNAVVVDEF